MGRKKKKDDRSLTDFELKVMNVFWQLGETNVHEVRDHISDEEEYAYNTVSTIVRILEKKEFLASRKEGRTHFYHPIISKSDYEDFGVNQMVNGLFGGAPMDLAKKLLGSSKFSKQDIEELKKLLDTKKD